MVFLLVSALGLVAVAVRLSLVKIGLIVFGVLFTILGTKS
jgi:hypothetical protein